MAVRCHVTILGDQGSSTDRLPWTINYQFGATVALGSAAAATAAQALFTALAASTPAKAFLSTTTRIVETRVAFHAVDNGPETSVGLGSGTAITGPSSQVNMPQVAVVATLRSATPGRQFRGRLYLPASGIALASDGSLVGAVQSLVNTAVQTISQQAIIAVGAAGSALSWYVWSPTRGAGAPITRVSVGSRCDTQRRRNSAVDTYLDFPVT